MTMQNEHRFTGRCLCGAVQLEVVGKPAAMGYCHCSSCRQWSAAPVSAFTLWAPGAVSITRGADQIGSFQKTERAIRRWCRSCGGHLLTDHPTWGVVHVHAAVLEKFPFDPRVHLNYAETVLRMRDGLPKMKDMPSDMGGSGIRLPE
ncbi:MAG: GFA family protein [Myxococcaceae bacterium]